MTASALVSSVKVAAIGAAFGAGGGVIDHLVSTGSLKGGGKAAINGAVDGFMWGGITAGASTVALASKGVYINKIGRLKPSNKPGKGYMGVRYGTKRSSNKFAYKSIELHSPHKGGPHQIWHWQRNKWSYIKKGKFKKIWTVSAKAKRWNICGRRI